MFLKSTINETNMKRPYMFDERLLSNRDKKWIKIQYFIYKIVKVAVYLTIFNVFIHLLSNLTGISDVVLLVNAVIAYIFWVANE